MGERKAIGKHYPPDFDPSKGTLNAQQGRKPAGSQGKVDDGIIIIRFELPFNIWCGGCGRHCARGTRYNAEKKHIGNYFSTRIFNFRMECATCSNWFEIETDPKNARYVAGKGCFQKQETWSAEDAETEKLDQKDVKEKLAQDAFFKLERGEIDKKKAKQNKSHLEDLIALKEDTHKDYYLMNQLMRRKLRHDKKMDEMKKIEDWKRNRNKPVPMLPPSESDREEAKKVRYASGSNYAEKSFLAAKANSRKKKFDIASASIFEGSKQVKRGPKMLEHEQRRQLAAKRQKLGVEAKRFKVVGKLDEGSNKSTPVVTVKPRKRTADEANSTDDAGAEEDASAVASLVGYGTSSGSGS